MKSCARCGQEKSLNEFAKNPSAKSGLSNKCKLCFNEQVRSRYTVDDRRKHHLKYKFKLTPEEYDRMVHEVNGICPACQKEKPLHIDHDHRCCSGKHSCGKCIRGLLCGSCNRGLGLLGENVETMKRLIAYVERNHSDEKSV